MIGKRVEPPKTDSAPPWQAKCTPLTVALHSLRLFYQYMISFPNKAAVFERKAAAFFLPLYRLLYMLSTGGYLHVYGINEG
jgi:hypothetical protein